MTGQGSGGTPLPASNPFSTRFIRPGALPYLIPVADGAPGGAQAAAQAAGPADERWLDGLLRRLALARWRGQIYGPHGSGKSTLLAMLLPRAEQQGRRVRLATLRDGQTRLPAGFLDWRGTVANDLLVVDGYEQLGWPARAALDLLTRLRGAGLLITTHRPGRLATVWETRTTPELARQLVSRLTAGGPGVEPAAVDAQFYACGGDLRQILSGMYDLYESQRS